MNQANPNDLPFLRLAIAQAYEARARGDDPFGAVLAYQDEVLQQNGDRSVTLSDPTAHAELHLISSYCRARHLYSLQDYTLYCSTEPCAMCAGAIHWARISRIVYSVSQALSQAMAQGKPKPSCEQIINSGHRRAEIFGPLLPDEGLAVFDGYVFEPKAVRHSRLWGDDLSGIRS